MNRRSFLFGLPVLAGISLASYALDGRIGRAQEGQTLQQRFDYLSTHGNSNCSDAFRDSISSMADSARLQGSCCSPMDFNTYVRQVTALRSYHGVAEIPNDPYDISAKLAKQLLSFDKTIVLSAARQAVLDDTVPRTDEKGYCCCPCWRWNTYEGLSKYLVQNYGFTADQIVDVLNNSDGCGGAS